MTVLETSIGAAPALQIPTAAASTPSLAPVALGLGALLAACGGGGGGDSGAATPGATTPVTAPATPVSLPTASLAARFLGQASMGATRAQIERVQAIGYSAWLDEQMAMAPTQTRWDWLVAKGFDAIANQYSEAGADPVIWRKMLSSPDTLRQRITFALSEILVTSVSGFSTGWVQFSAAAYLDLLEANAFGNYRTLLQQVSTSAPMGEYLTYRGSVKQNLSTGAMPDENYAREVMQLFTIGLVQLNLDGTPKLNNGATQETYTLDDVTGLARVFTGWGYDMTGTVYTVPEFKRRPMIVTAKNHETGTKTFLGTTIAAGTTGENSLTMALDAIFAHASLAPNISRQLIQRLVTSNPSPAYVTRVTAVFNNDGSGAKGNLKAVIKAVLLDDEARNPANLSNASFGKQREPILRLASWVRATDATSTADAWTIGNTSDPSNRLGQSPLRSSSVFNFFRPGYVPPNSPVATSGMVAPEFGITNESSVVGYLNYMQGVVKNGAGDVKPTYAAWMALSDSSQGLLDEINLVMANGQLSGATIALLKGALDTMGFGTDVLRLNRIYTALVLVLAAPEFIIQK
ncbi:DUF1800 domain-containing protein [Massilia sp. S19_KUP03_FR1]|uniref:DUF1800 domain-containing protein n=1 Tax=Massilia sp. S19_KUP03_FR1 TaxID=3025503 RepID=UPI002FCDCE76